MGLGGAGDAFLLSVLAPKIYLRPRPILCHREFLSPIPFSADSPQILHSEDGAGDSPLGSLPLSRGDFAPSQSLRRKFPAFESPFRAFPAGIPAAPWALSLRRGATASASAFAAAGRALTASEGIGSTVSHCDFDLNLLAFPNFNKFFVQTISLLFIVLLLLFEHRGHGGDVVMLAAEKDSHGGVVVGGIERDEVSSFRRVFKMEHPPTSEAEDFDGPDESNGVVVSANVNLLELLTHRVKHSRPNRANGVTDLDDSISQGDAHSEGLDGPLTDGYGGLLTDQGQDQSPSF
ncbi:hypothetical protein PIB30_075788 [Stylosanthes scabra]|uniref:Uncharacterized protein n=1 Tax=Stylosanthes scabra TaxID=79078 RepID=A0ABU6QQ36_9FABA|nr:hypothetical protein [Stylosanthes scabra]